MAEHIDEIKRRLLKNELERTMLQQEKIEPEVVEFKGHKIQQINPINSKTRQLFNQNVRDKQQKIES